jgi:hypothetical protein
MAGLPPSPDRSQQPKVISQTVIEVTYSPSSLARGIITVDTQGVYRIRTEFWDTRDWDSGGAPFWALAHSGTFTDTLANARQLCRERLHETVDPTE